MNFSYPFYDTNSPYYDSDTLWGALEQSTAGGFTLGGNGFWHGGVHFESGTGISENRAVRSIGDGVVVAYRLNKEYLKKDDETEGATTFGYSTSFVLIRHNFQSLFGIDTQGAQTQNRNELVFYSLYMHLKPFSEYEDDELSALSYCEGETHYIVTENAIDGGVGLNMRTISSSVNNMPITQLPVGAKVKVSSYSDNNKWGQVSEIVSGYDDYEGVLGWIYIDNNETSKLSVPNQFDLVRTINTPIKAGKKIGTMGKYDAPASSTNGRKQLHLEIFSTSAEADITNFLSNQANVNLPETHDIYVIPQNTTLSNITESENPDTASTFTEFAAKTSFQVTVNNTRELQNSIKKDASDDSWIELEGVNTYGGAGTSANGWVKISGSDPSTWSGFDQTPVNATADGAGYYKSVAPNTLMTNLLSRIEPSYVSGAETPVMRQVYNQRAKQSSAKGAIPRAIIKHNSEWSSTHTTALMAVIESEELIPDDENITPPDGKRTRFQERKEELEFWEDAGLGTTEAFYFHPLAFIEHMMRMQAYYEAVIHVTSEIKTEIVLNADGSVASAPDYGGYNDLENGYISNNVVYCKKKSADFSYFPTFKGYIYRGLGSEAKVRLAKDLENGNRDLAENDVFEIARHTKETNRNYDENNPVPPTATDKYYEVKYRLSSTYRYRITSPREDHPLAFPEVANNLELHAMGALLPDGTYKHAGKILPRAGINILRSLVSFDPWKSKSLEGCLGFRGNGGTPIGLSAGITNKYLNISNHIEGKVPELRGVYGRLYANQPSAVTEYDKHTRVWLKVESLPDVDHIKNGGQ